ncbi:putative FAD/NAD(P)-binding domain-containing protein [Seiridium cardinale]
MSILSNELRRENVAEQPHRAAAIVVGGGAAGIAALGNLLERIESGTIAWIDPEFQGGRIPCAYEEVPSNTKAGLFIKYATAYEPFRDIIRDTPVPNAFTVLESLPQDKPCSLRYAGQLLQMLSDGLARNSRVECYQGCITQAAWCDKISAWALCYQASSNAESQVLNAEMVIYCTGSSPTTAPLPLGLERSPKPLDLDLALKPSALCKSIPSHTKTTVGVIGASHSAILVIMNLVRLARASHSLLQVCWFTRSTGVKYARYEDGRIFYDNTGLKGEAAEFARTHLDGDRLQNGPIRDVVRRVDCSGGVAKERDVLLGELPRCDYVVQAIGYTPNALPAMNMPFRFDNSTGGFVDGKSGRPMKGLHGAGIAFPERVVDPSGDVEYAVGFFKFMSFLKRVVPQWVSDADLDVKKVGTVVPTLN